MLAQGMSERGHNVEVWTARPLFFKLPAPKLMKKWLGYLDLFVVFPKQVKIRLSDCPSDTLFVFTDQALGPWVPLLRKYPHVVHCHDFLAQLSALDRISANKTTYSGKLYQYYIRSGYTKAVNFISVSNRTKEDLHKFLPSTPKRSYIVYNGLDNSFKPQEVSSIRSEISQETGINLKSGYILHVGGNQWYKNRIGVIEIYNSWRLVYNLKLPLLLVGQSPTKSLVALRNTSPFKDDIHFLINGTDSIVRKAYAGASTFLFPSLAEGFGWPIAEAMASGTIVITTDASPMTEVAGNSAFLIPPRPTNNSEIDIWANEAAKVVNKVLTLTDFQRQQYIKAGILNAKRFDKKLTLDKIESIYQEIVDSRNILI